MRARLELMYNLNDVYESNKIRDMLRIDNFKSVLWDLDQYLRGIVKHGISESEVMRDLNKSWDGTEIVYTAEEKDKIMTGFVEACDQIRTKLWELLREENISFDE